MLLGILVILLVGGYSLAWVVGGPLLYIEGRIEEVALVTTPNEDVGEDGELFFALSYNACRGVKEHIVLGKKDMGKKTIPKRLKRIRECLMGLTPGSTVPSSSTHEPTELQDPRPGVSVVSEPVHCLTCRLGSQFNLSKRRDRCALLVHVNPYLVAKPSMAISAWPKGK